MLVPLTYSVAFLFVNRQVKCHNNFPCFRACSDKVTCITLVFVTNELRGGQKLMDFRQTIQPNNSRPGPVSAAPVAPEKKESRMGGRFNGTGSPQWMRILSVILLAGIAVLLIGI